MIIPQKNYSHDHIKFLFMAIIHFLVKFLHLLYLNYLSAFKEAYEVFYVSKPKYKI